MYILHNISIQQICQKAFNVKALQYFDVIFKLYKFVFF